ncbi:MAG: CoA protein activase [Chloroflexi bacterium]|nr:CoA protein activase [Chloroflexota bacterium]
MKVALPHMGNVHIPLRSVFTPLGVEMVIPPPYSRRTMSLGTQYSPEFVCLPFKLTLGSYVEALEAGADTLLMIAGPGLCRFGCYARQQEQILHDMGYDFQMITTELFENRAAGVVNLLKRVTNDAPMRDIIRTFRFGMAKFGALDKVEEVVYHVRAVEIEKGTATKIWREAMAAIDQAENYDALKATVREQIGRLKMVPAKPSRPLKVAIIGEFYIVLEPFSNLDVEVELGKLDVQVEPTIKLSQWTRFSLFFAAMGFSGKKKIFRAARPYLKRDVGGDGWESVGETVLHAKHGYDGVLHLAPFTCMPEIIAQNIFPEVLKQNDIPVLTITCDEQMARAGLVTRLEAFVDLMKRRRAREKATVSWLRPRSYVGSSRSR